MTEATADNGPANEPRAGVFATTRWSLVLNATEPDAAESATALASLCESYWRPLYAYVRRRGYNPHDAQDLTQEFFAFLCRETTSPRPTRTAAAFAPSCWAP